MRTALLTLHGRWVPYVVKATIVAGACAGTACGLLPDDDIDDKSQLTEAERAALELVASSLPASGPGAGFPLVFHGGFVQVDPKVFLAFWGPKWNTDATHRAVIARVEETFRALPGGHYNNVLTQYGAAETVHVHNNVWLRGTTIDTSLPPSRIALGIDLGVQIPMKKEIRDAAFRAIDTNRWPVDRSTQVLVFPQQGSTYVAEDCVGCCSAHSYANSRGLAYGVVKWPADDACANTGSLAEDIAWLAVHEYGEMATNPNIHLRAEPPDPPLPFPPIIRATADGWHTAEFALRPHEVFDKCENWNVHTTAGKSLERRPLYQTVFPPGATYTLPFIWSNATNRCEKVAGREFLSPDTIPPFHRKHTVQGPILSKYLAMGADTGLLGAPAYEEIRFPGGAVSYFTGQVCNGGHTVLGRSTGSAIYHHRSSGAVHEVHGCIYQKYSATGGPFGLGWPTSDEIIIPGGRVSYFQGRACRGAPLGPARSGSAIYASEATGAYAVQGCIYRRYIELGAATSSGLGFPISDELRIPGGSISYFQHGHIFADGTQLHVVNY